MDYPPVYASVSVITAPYIEIIAIRVDTLDLAKSNQLVVRSTLRTIDRHHLAFTAWYVNEVCRGAGLEAIPVPLVRELWEQLLSEGVRA